LAKFFASGSRAGIQAAHAERLRLILAALNAAVAPADMGLPGLRLHPLKGRRSGSWSVSVSGNWRITFKFSGKDAVDVDYEDYH
jgi:proteic killer suppression protein